MSAARLEVVARQICDHRQLAFRGLLGQGAFKETYLVEGTDGELLALKILLPGHNPERTAREIEAMLRCSHPNVARLRLVDSLGVDGVEHVYMLEEYLSGGTLGTLLERGLLSRPQVIHLARRLVDALGHIAELGLVHRDLKPENIMFRGGIEAPVVVDFGIVRDLTSRSLTQTWFMRGPGTPYFAAPEQLNNEKELIDWRTDQFSLGIVLAICICGRHPYEDVVGNSARTVEQVATRIGPTEQFRAAIAEVGFTLLERMVSPWPVQRFRRPEQLIQAWEETGENP